MADKIRRTTIQQALAPRVAAAVKEVEAELGLTGVPDEHRRVFRALVTLAAQQLLNAGCPPQVALQQAFEAIGSEVQHRAQQAQALGQPFGLLPPASA